MAFMARIFNIKNGLKVKGQKMAHVDGIDLEEEEESVFSSKEALVGLRREVLAAELDKVKKTLPQVRPAYLTAFMNAAEHFEEEALHHQERVAKLELEMEMLRQNQERVPSEELDSIKAQLSEKTSEVYQTQEEIDVLTQKLAQKEEEAAKVQEQVAAKDQELGQAKAETEARQQKIEELELKIESVSKDFEEKEAHIRSELEQLNEQVRQKDEELAQKSEAFVKMFEEKEAEMKSKAETFEAEKTEILNLVTQLQQDIENSTKQNEELKASTDSKISEQQALIEQQSEKISSCESEIVEKAQSIESLKEEISQKTNEFESRKSALIAEKTNQANDFEKQKAALNTKIDEKTKRIAELEDSLANERAKSKGLEENITKLNEQIENLTQDKETTARK